MLYRGRTVIKKMYCMGKWYVEEKWGYVHELVFSQNFYYCYLFIDTPTSATSRHIIIVHSSIIIYLYILVDSTINIISTFQHQIHLRCPCTLRVLSSHLLYLHVVLSFPPYNRHDCHRFGPHCNYSDSYILTQRTLQRIFQNS